MSEPLLQQIQDIFAKKYCETLYQPKCVILSSKVYRLLLDEIKAYVIHPIGGIVSIFNLATGEYVSINERDLPGFTDEQVIMLSKPFGVWSARKLATNPEDGFIAEAVL